MQSSELCPGPYHFRFGNKLTVLSSENENNGFIFSCHYALSLSRNLTGHCHNVGLTRALKIRAHCYCGREQKWLLWFPPLLYTDAHLESYFFLTATIYCYNRRCICLIGTLGYLASLNTHHVEYQTKYSNYGLEAIWISEQKASVIFWLCPQWPSRSARRRPCQGHNGAVNGIDYMTETWAHTPVEESFLIFRPNLKKCVQRLLVFLFQPAPIGLSVPFSLQQTGICDP